VHLQISSRRLIAALAVIAFAFRALIPAGFMPDSVHPLSLTICPEGMDPQLMSHDMGGGHAGSHVDHCPFGSVPASGPLSNIAVISSIAFVAPTAVIAYQTVPVRIRLVHIAQPRGPPRAV